MQILVRFPGRALLACPARTSVARRRETGQLSFHCVTRNSPDSLIKPISVWHFAARLRSCVRATPVSPWWPSARTSALSSKSQSQRRSRWRVASASNEAAADCHAVTASSQTAAARGSARLPRRNDAAHSVTADRRNATNRPAQYQFASFGGWHERPAKLTVLVPARLWSCLAEPV